MITDDIAAALVPIIQAFEELAIPYYIGGSVASSTHGLPRTTIDIDLIADLKTSHVDQLVERLGGMYYIDALMIHEAIRLNGSFNVIHYETVIKVDIFVLKQDPYDRAAFGRASSKPLAQLPKHALFFASPEDVILHKLYWYRLGGEVSERQWTDVLGVLKVQREALDSDYMQRWAAQLDVLDLLRRSLLEAGLSADF